MEIQDFLTLWEGQWFSQRSNYDFNRNVAESHKSELTIETLAFNHPTVVEFAQSQDIPTSEQILGLQMGWDNSVDWGKPKQTGSLLYLFLPHPEHSHHGQLRRSPLKIGQKALVGKYLFAVDESLTLILEQGPLQIEERLWFASPNLRLRTSLVLQNHQFSHSAFYTEIRKLPPTKTE
jgi:hypothetical protein